VKALAESGLAVTALLNQGVDFLIDRGIAAAIGTTPESVQPGLHLFAVLSGGNLRHKTGSHIDVDGLVLATGFSGTRATPAGELTLGAFFEHGEADYSTHPRTVRGRGDAEYSGGGILARLAFDETSRGHFYAEATARAGKIDLDFRSADGTRKTRSDYASAHAGMGYVLKLSERSTLNLYGQTLWSRQGSDAVELKGDGRVKFDPIESLRTRAGVRWSSQNSNRTGQLYFGASWEREYDGKARAKLEGYRLTTPQLKGDTALLETGFVLNPVKPLTLEFGVQGHTGRREGVTGSFRMEYRF
jgi:outer membrane autotransporter protein